VVSALDMLGRASHVSKCLELAVLLEASAHKPGNVSVVTNFESTRYEHFLASAVAARPFFEFACERGVAVHEGKIDVADVGVGNIIRRCVEEIDAWQHGGNTLLGTVILLSPIAVAAGMAVTEDDFGVRGLRADLKSVVESTTPEDAIDVYGAIKIARPSGLGKAPRLDVNDPASASRILEEKTTLFQVFRIAEKYDMICSEWVNNYPVTFDVAYPALEKQMKNGADPNVAVIQVFLKVLAEYPDTFIARKTSFEKAREVSLEAEGILDLGGLTTAEGRQSLNKFDRELRKSSNLLNPGTTADIIAAALALCILSGYRP
jgi:triphosphoribosyl-dephospho-CoA synthase